MPYVALAVVATVLAAIVGDSRKPISTGPWLKHERALWHLLFELRTTVYVANVLFAEFATALVRPRDLDWLPHLASLAAALVVSHITIRWWSRSIDVRAQVRTADGLRPADFALDAPEHIRFWASVPALGWARALGMLMVSGGVGMAAGLLLP